VAVVKGEAEVVVADVSGKNGVWDTLTGDEAAALSHQIASLTSAGLPLAPGLAALGEELPRGRLRRSLNELADTLESGVLLDEAIEKQERRIPPHLRGLVIAGIRSGRLGDVLSRFTAYAGIGTELRRKLWLALAYPILAMTLALAVFGFVNAIVVSKYEAIFKDFNIPIPLLTVIVIGVSHAFRGSWPVLVILGGRGGGAWRPPSRSWGAYGAGRRSRSSAIFWPCSWKVVCPCRRPCA
jgi:type II secretory pathway component PulF